MAAQHVSFVSPSHVKLTVWFFPISGSIHSEVYGLSSIDSVWAHLPMMIVWSSVYQFIHFISSNCERWCGACSEWMNAMRPERLAIMQKTTKRQSVKITPNASHLIFAFVWFFFLQLFFAWNFAYVSRCKLCECCIRVVNFSHGMNAKGRWFVVKCVCTCILHVENGLTASTLEMILSLSGCVWLCVCVRVSVSQSAKQRNEEKEHVRRAQCKIEIQLNERTKEWMNRVPGHSHVPTLSKLKIEPT